VRPFLFLERRWRAGTGRPDNGCRLRVAASLGLSAGAQALADAIVKLQYSPLHMGVGHAGALAEHPDRLMSLLNVSPEFGCADGEEQFLRIAFFHHAVMVKVRECFEKDTASLRLSLHRPATELPSGVLAGLGLALAALRSSAPPGGAIEHGPNTTNWKD